MRQVLLTGACVAVTMHRTTPDNPCGLLRDVDILIGKNGSIAAIGPGLIAPEALVCPVDGRVLLPGFVNAHDHLWQTLIRGMACREDLMAWLPPMLEAAAAQTEATAYAGVRLGAAHMLHMGVTTVLDWSHARSLGFLSGNLRALNDSGVRWVLAYAGPKSPSADALLRASTGLDGCMGFQYATHPAPHLEEDVTLAGQAAKAWPVPINVHLLENKAQRSEHPAALLAGAIDPSVPLIANHAVHCTQADLDILAKFNLSVVHCPMSNMRLASGIIDWPLFEHSGISIGLGLDGGTNDSGDMFETMRCAMGLQRANLESVNKAPSSDAVLRMATLGAAEVLGIASHVGSLAVGKRADIVVLQPKTLNAPCLATTIDSIVYCMNSMNVEHVLVGGHFRKQNHQLVDVDTQHLIAEAQKAASQISRGFVP